MEKKTIQIDKGNWVIKVNQRVYEHEDKEKGCNLT